MTSPWMIVVKRLPLLSVATLVLACGTAKPGGMSGPTMNNRVNAQKEPAPPALQSNDILQREPVTNQSEVKHILISFKDIADKSGGRVDPRAKSRSRADADALVKELAQRARNGDDFDALMAEYSEDPGSASSGRSYTVEPGAQLVLEFRQLGLRLRVGEVGIVMTDYGWHVIKRLK